jgi:protein TonB
MLAYAPRPDRRRLQPSALALIIGAHALAIVAVMSARMDATGHRDPPITVTSIPIQPDPQPPKPQPRDPHPSNQPISAPEPFQPLPLPGPSIDPQPMPMPDPGPIFGNGSDPTPMPQPTVHRTGPRFVTPEAAIRPPYPEEKRRLEQEATLQLRLSIDEHGRVVAVDPVGRADPSFLAAARRHILKAWRYQPAMEGDRAIASTTVITLEFKLN